MLPKLCFALSDKMGAAVAVLYVYTCRHLLSSLSGHLRTKIHLLSSSSVWALPSRLFPMRLCRLAAIAVTAAVTESYCRCRAHINDAMCARPRRSPLVPGARAITAATLARTLLPPRPLFSTRSDNRKHLQGIFYRSGLTPSDEYKTQGLTCPGSHPCSVRTTTAMTCSLWVCPRGAQTPWTARATSITAAAPPRLLVSSAGSLRRCAPRAGPAPA